MVDLTISIHTKKWKISHDQKQFFRPISMKYILGTFQTILRRKKNFVEKHFFLEKNVRKKMLSKKKIMGRGLHPPRTPHRAAPLDPACLWIENSSGNRLALNGIQFFLEGNIFFLKSSETYPKNIWNFFLRFSKNVRTFKKKIPCIEFFSS